MLPRHLFLLSSLVLYSFSLASSTDASTNLIRPSLEGMKAVPGGVFTMGCEGCNLADAEPLHPVELSLFWIDESPVTNAQFAAFVATSHYLTVAERKPDPKDYPGVPEDDLVPGSAVFTPHAGIKSLADALAWWTYVPGANWRFPDGPKKVPHGLEQHPVVHIAYDDAQAYCSARGKRLPTEAEFEYAARGGLVGKRYAWGDELKPKGKWAANIWQGLFPLHNTGEDGYLGTSPVRAFPANGYGLYDMGGNVWQWTSDWYRPDTYAAEAAAGTVKDPKGPASGNGSFDGGTAKRVQRGGSFLCSDRYCTRYLVGSRGKGASDSSGPNVGFRCVQDSPTSKEERL